MMNASLWIRRGASRLLISVLRRTRRERGQSLIMVAAAMVVLIGFVGLAVDGAMVMAARRDLVKLTDAAALAGAGALTATRDVPDTTLQARAIARARQYAALHGHNPDGDPCWAVLFPEWGVKKRVEVHACRRVDLAFMPLLGFRQVTVRAGPLGDMENPPGHIAEAAPVDIVIVQDVSASQCYDNYAEPATGGWCSRLLQNPPNQSPSVIRPYNPTLPTRMDVPWCGPSNNRHPCCLNPAGNWHACPLGGTSPANVPWMPFAMQQDAARFFAAKLDPRYDQVGLVSFSSRVTQSETPYLAADGWPRYDLSGDRGARVHQRLTNNVAAVQAAIGHSPRINGERGARGLFPGGRTNIARGISEGVAVLTGPGSRPEAVSVMILLGDGSPTVRMDGSTPSGCSSAAPQHCNGPRADTQQQAILAARQGIIIYTVFVGATGFAEDHALMLQYIADVTDNGREDLPSGLRYNLPNHRQAFDPVWFRANVSENYFLATDEQQLRDAYQQILDRIYTRLVE